MNALDWLLAHDFGELTRVSSVDALPPGWRPDHAEGLSRYAHKSWARVWRPWGDGWPWAWSQLADGPSVAQCATLAEAMARATARHLGMLAAQQLRPAAKDRLDLLGVVGGPEHVLVVKDKFGPGSFHDPHVITRVEWDRLRGIHRVHLVTVIQ